MKIYLFLADGFETVEALAPVDVFKRAHLDIQTVSITDSKTVTSSHGVAVQADCCLKENDLSDGDALILPGGFPGYKNLCDSKVVGETVRKYYISGKVVGAICGAPTVLQCYGIAKGSRITCHHTVKEQMTDFTYTGKDVEQDRNLITSIGAGHAFDFALALLYSLQGGEKVDKVKAGLELQ
jgi:4-methyl-5(b-hydroxyethyl)-thiazole monophosphate biosynthesis